MDLLGLLLLFSLFDICAALGGTKTLHPDGFRYNECPPQDQVCEFWLQIEEKLTMIFRRDLVYAHEGKLYLYNEDPSNYSTEVPEESVITADGVNRMFSAVNGSLPGPPIVVYEDQKVIVHIRNTLLSDSATIHFHGLHQRDTPFFDGMPYVSQCPIAAGQTFTHEFKAMPKGTFWYHSHVGSQRTNGVFGPFIIKQRPVPGVILPIDMIMTVGDWHHAHSDEIYTKMVYGNFIGRDKYHATSTLDGGHFSGVPWVSALINGRGRYIDRTTGKKIMAPLAWFNVTKGKTYRFRTINVGAIYPLRVSVDGHALKMVASDGYDFEPFVVESFVINPGERYDFLLDATEPIGNYWIRAVSMEANVKDHSVEAVLHYKDASDGEPTTERHECTQQSECILLNCPFRHYPPGTHIKCVMVSEMKNVDKEDPAPEWRADSEEYFLNFAFPGQKVTPGSVNGRKFEFPGVNTLFQAEQLEDYDCDNADCGDDKICYCHYQIVVPYNKTIQMIWSNMGSGAGWGHPIHIHGHSFYLLKMEYPPQDNTTALLTGQSQDIDCGGGLMFCNSAKWRDPSWENGHVPGMNLVDPPRKDTVIIPSGGYVVLRIQSTNPGKWFLHCHIEVHALDGMALVLNEAPEVPIRHPAGFPICTNFYNDNSRDMTYIKMKQKDKDEKPHSTCPNRLNLITIVALAFGLIIIVESMIIIVCVSSGRKKRSPPKHSTT